MFKSTMYVFLYKIKKKFKQFYVLKLSDIFFQTKLYVFRIPIYIKQNIFRFSIYGTKINIDNFFLYFILFFIFLKSATRYCIHKQYRQTHRRDLGSKQLMTRVNSATSCKKIYSTLLTR